MDPNNGNQMRYNGNNNNYLMDAFDNNSTYLQHGSSLSQSIFGTTRDQSLNIRLNALHNIPYQPPYNPNNVQVQLPSHMKYEHDFDPDGKDEFKRAGPTYIPMRAAYYNPEYSNVVYSQETSRMPYQTMTDDGMLLSDLSSGRSQSPRGSQPTLGPLAEREREKAIAIRRVRENPSALDTSSIGDEDDGDTIDKSPHHNGGDNAGELTGRWTKQEHDIFLEALKKFGKV